MVKPSLVFSKDLAVMIYMQRTLIFVLLTVTVFIPCKLSKRADIDSASFAAEKNEFYSCMLIGFIFYLLNLFPAHSCNKCTIDVYIDTSSVTLFCQIFCVLTFFFINPQLHRWWRSCRKCSLVMPFTGVGKVLLFIRSKF